MTAPAATAAPPSPWTAKQRLLLGVLLAVGVAGLIAGYVGTSGTLRVSRQVAWINVTGVGLLISGAGIIFFLTAARREIGRRRLSLFGDVAGTTTVDVTTAAGPAAAGDFVAAPTMTRYHRSDCSFVEGKQVQAANAASHRQNNRKPCGVCLPGGES